MPKINDGKHFGLVWENHHPGYEPLWNNEVKSGVLVKLLNPRGEKPLFYSDDVWKVDAINDSIATIENNDGRITTWNVEDLVVVADLNEYNDVQLVHDGEVIGGDKDDVYHSIINGENLLALKLLEKTHAGKIDAIYIDPPYNTGAKAWKYNNHFFDKSDKYRHSKWLSFMDERLRIAKKLLNPDNSVLIVTIDEKEYLRTGLLLEEIFPEASIQMVSSVISQKGAYRERQFHRTNEFLYFVQMGKASPSPLALNKDWSLGKNESIVAKKGITWSGLRRGGDLYRRHSPGCFYPIYIKDNDIVEVGDPIPPHISSKEFIDHYNGDCEIVLPIDSHGNEVRWQHTPSGLKKLKENGYVKVGRNNSISYLSRGNIKKIENGSVKIIGYDETDGHVIVDSTGYIRSFVPGTQWNIASHDASTNGTNAIKAILGDRRFDYPKSLYAVEDALRFFVKDKPNAVILDFFGGSGTTAHAVMRLNLEDGGSRKAIVISNNEVSDDEKKDFIAKGLRPSDDEWNDHGICQYVTKPRVKAVITGKTAKSGFVEDIKGNYRYNQEFPISDGIKANARFFNLVVK